MFLISHFPAPSNPKVYNPNLRTSHKKNVKEKRDVRKVFEVCSPVSARSELEQRKKRLKRKDRIQRNTIFRYFPFFIVREKEIIKQLQ